MAERRHRRIRVPFDMNRAAEGVHLHGLAGDVPRSATTLTRRVTLSGLCKSPHPPLYKGFGESRPPSTAGFRFNGPIVFIRGSHKRGASPTTLDTETTSYPLWVVDNETVTDLVAEGGLVAAKGPPGTVLIFGDTLVHGSSINMTPWPRTIFSLILNPVSNALSRHNRPEHQHHRDLSPVVPLADACLLAGATG